MATGWLRHEVADWNGSNLELLLAGRLPAVRIPDFASPLEIRSLSEWLPKLRSRSQTLDGVERIGISQYQEGVCGSKALYFEKSGALKCEQRELFRRTFDPIARLCQHLVEAGYDASVLVEPGWGEYYAGVGKLRRRATPMHVDFSEQDSPGWRVGQALAQLAWNLYLNTPDGGELRVWDRQWTRKDDAFAEEHGFVFSGAVVAGVPSLKIPVVQGDVILINSRNYHAVGDTDERLTFGSFISYFPDIELGLWS